MEKSFFRKKSLEYSASSENLNEYVRISGTGTWLVLVASIIFIVGLVYWATSTKLDSVVSVGGMTKNGVMTMYVKESDRSLVKVGQYVKMNDLVLVVEAVSPKPVSVTPEMDEYLLKLGGLLKGEWVYPVYVRCNLPDGVYGAKIVVDVVTPLHFLLN